MSVDQGTRKPPRVGASLEALLDAGSLAGLTDGELLDRFRAGHRPTAEASFASLVQRHGPMVLKVCRDLLGDPHDADDAFQAVFLALARQADGIRRRDALGCWLYGVARRVSLRLRRRRARLRLRERPGLEQRAEPAAAPVEDPWPELHDEVDRLPARFRAAVVLCDLQGCSYEQAAALLACPVGTLQSRLARGRQRLRQRLERRGLGRAIAVLPGGPILRPSLPVLPEKLVAGTVASVLEVPKGAGSLAGQLARAELRGPWSVRLGMVAAVGLLTAIVAGGIALAPGQRPAADAAPQPVTPRRQPVTVRVVDAQGRPVGGIRVETTGWELHETKLLTSAADGFLAIPAWSEESSLTLLARHGDALGWVAFQGDDLGGVAGTRADPVLLRLRPLDHRVKGSVVDEHGKGIAGAEVVAQGMGDGREGPLTGRSMYVIFSDQLPSLPRARTDGEGRYEIALPAGPATLVARHPSFQAMGGHVDAASRTADRIELEPGGWINGRVVDAATNQPLPGVRLGAQLIETRRVVKGGWGEATVGADGRFAITGLEPGVYNLHFLNAPGRPSATARAVQGLRVGLKQGTAALMKVIEGRPLRGVVLSRPGDRPVPGVAVGCYGPARPQSGAAVMAVKTDASGAFTFHVPPGQQYVYLMDPGAESRLGRRTVVVPERGPMEEVRLVKLENPPPMRVGMIKKAVAPVQVAEVPQKAAEKAVDAAPVQLRTIHGWVRDLGNEPVVAARVQLDPTSARLLRPVPGAPPGSADMAATDREGFFELAGVPAAALTVWITRPGYQGQQATVPADRDEVQITSTTTAKPPARDQQAVRRDDPVPAALRERLLFLDLSTAGNEQLADGPGGAGNDLQRLPRGVRDLDGRYFRVGEELIHLAGQTGPGPREVKGLRVGARVQTLHFLHGVQQVVRAGTEVGAYVVHYADGSSERIPIVYGRDVVNWWHWFLDRQELPSAARIAWNGSNDASERNGGLEIRLYALAWTNPHPDREIATIDFLSAGTTCDPFLVAATAERPR